MKLPDILWKAEYCVQFQAGSTVLKEGEMGNTLLVLMEGHVEVRIKDRVVGEFQPVEVFGEMAVIDSQPRSATVIAKDKCRFARIDQNRFKALIQQRPEFGIEIMRMLVERMRWMDTVAAKAGTLISEQPEEVRKSLTELKVSLESLTGQIKQLLQKF